ncbi:MAG: HU family DNA-binding protein [Clostridia bacterium]|nr:HU family DNA-binding protein [Clostridia bacterium]
MNKTEFIKAIADKADLSLSDATAAVNAYTAVITEALKAGDKVTLGGFGTYEVKEKPERQGFNPITKQPITIAASKNPNLKFGKAFKELF